MGYVNLDLRSASLLAHLQRAVDDARQEFFRGHSPEPIDGDTYQAPVDEQQDLLNRIERMHHDKSGSPRPLEERESVSGLPQTDADKRVHSSLRDRLLADDPNAIVVGEEADGSDWDLLENASRGTVVYSIDAIDGSGPHDTLSFGFSANLLMYIRTRDGSDRLMISAVVNSSGFGLLFKKPGEVVKAFQGEREVLLTPMVRKKDIRSGTVAVVGALPPHRRMVGPIFDTEISWGLPPLEYGNKKEEDPPATVYTTGGAPAALGLALGRLDALVVPNTQSVHDSAWLPALLALGIAAYGPKGRLAHSDIMNCFDKLSRPEPKSLVAEESGPTFKPIPAMTLARDEEFGRRLAGHIFNEPGGFVLRAEGSLRTNVIRSKSE